MVHQDSFPTRELLSMPSCLLYTLFRTEIALIADTNNVPGKAIELWDGRVFLIPANVPQTS
jgi:hypothetical protein